jgi:hypothetical protein
MHHWVCQNFAIDFMPPMILTFSSIFVLAKLPAITPLSSAFNSISQLQFLIFSMVYILYERAIVSKQDFVQVVGQSSFSL